MLIFVAFWGRNSFFSQSIQQSVIVERETWINTAIFRRVRNTRVKSNFLFCCKTFTPIDVQKVHCVCTMVNASPAAQGQSYVKCRAMPLAHFQTCCLFVFEVFNCFKYFLFLLLLSCWLWAWMEASDWEMTMLRSFQFSTCTLRTE